MEGIGRVHIINDRVFNLVFFTQLLKCLLSPETAILSERTGEEKSLICMFIFMYNFTVTAE